MISLKLLVALVIGGIFVYIKNKKTKKRLQNHFKEKLEKEKDESIH